jgi:hypothetical protein
MKTRLISLDRFCHAILGAGRDCCAGPWPIQDGSGGRSGGIASRGEITGRGGSKVGLK